MVEFLIGFLKMNDVEYAENRLLRDFSSVGIGGMAPIIAFPDNTPKLCNIVCFLEKQKIKYFYQHLDNIPYYDMLLKNLSRRFL